MPLRIEEVGFADGKEISRVYISAFAPDEFNQTLFPGMGFDRLLEGAISRWHRTYGSLGSYYLKVVDDEIGLPVSYSKWTFRNTDARSTLPSQTGFPNGFEASPPSTPEGLDDPLAIEFSNQCTAAIEKYAGDRPTLRLSMMGTTPEHQGRGAASLMLKKMTDFADEQGLVCYTEGSPKGLPVYKRFGFEEVDTIAMPTKNGGTYVYTCIIREPKTKPT